jgi:hypothetical protein
MNTLLLFLVSVFLFSNFSVNCVFLFSGSTDRRIRRALLASLSRFQGKEAPLTASGLNSFESAPSQGMNFASNDFPLDLKQKILSDHLDFKHLSIISQVNRSLKNEVKISTEHRLTKFHSHFATEDPLVNNLLYSVLNEHFRSINSSNDPLIHDYLQLLCAKYFFDDLDFSVIPSNIYYYIICFMFEMIYETNLRTPVSIFEFLNDFVCSLRVSEHSLENSYAYVFSKCQNESMHSNTVIDIVDRASLTNFNAMEDLVSVYGTEAAIKWSNICEYLEFFHSKPSIEEIKSKFSLGHVVSFDSISACIFEGQHFLPPMIIVAVLEAFLPEISDRELPSVLELFAQTNIFSYYSALLVEKMTLDLVELWTTNRKYSANFNELDMFGSFDVLRIDSYSRLFKPDCSVQHSSIYALMDLEYLFMFHKDPNIYFIELLIKEIKESIDLITITEMINISKTCASFTRLLVNGLPNDDPFLFLYLPVKVLKQVKCLIQDKFDLNYFYFMQEERQEVHLEPSDLGYNMRNSSSFSFKEAVNSFGNGHDEEVISIFTSNTEEFKDFTSIKLDAPIIKDRSNIQALFRLFEQEKEKEMVKWSPSPIHLIGFCILAIFFLYKTK